MYEGLSSIGCVVKIKSLRDKFTSMITGIILQITSYDDLSVIVHIVKIQRLMNPTTMNIKRSERIELEFKDRFDPRGKEIKESARSSI